MDVYQLWGQTAKDSVDRYAKKQTRETKEDLEQECMLLILEKQHIIDRLVEEQGREAANNYIYASCHNRITRLLKEEGRLNSGLSVDDHGMINEIENHEAKVIPNLGVTEIELDEAIKQLPRSEQHVIRSIFFQKMSEEAVGKSLGKSTSWVHRAKKDAISQLRQILEVK